MISIKPLFYKSNKFNYCQILINKKIFLSIRSDFSLLKELNLKEKTQLEKILHLYKNNKISYTTVKFFLQKLNPYNSFSKMNYSLLNIITEFAWESGFIKNDNKLSFNRKKITS
jgi:hypothetical protein